MIQQTINDAVTMGGADALLANRYRVVRQLGQGGMGSVYLAEDTKLDNKLFALKMLPTILVANKRAYQQLKAEALVAMKLVHPNIVQLRAFEEEHGNPFLVMDYIEGLTLDDYLAEKGTLSEDETVKLLTPVAAALDYAHGKGVVHRDVKPGNVMIAKDGTPFILDFGIAREIQETMTRVTGKLSSGTLLYMSPEQLRGLPPASSQDVYSFAAMAYECLKGEPPFVRGAIEDQIKNEPPSPLPGGSRFSASVMAGLAKKPEDRPPTCAAVLGGSAAAQADAGLSERKSGGAGKVLAIAALLAALAVGGYFAWPRNNAEAKAREKKNVPVVAEPRAEEVRPERKAKEEKARAAEFSRLTTRIRIKTSDARERMERVNAFRADPDGLEKHFASADGQWKALSTLAAPKSVEEAQSMFEKADKAEAQIALDLDWLEKNKAARDAARSAKAEIDALLSGEIATFKADRYAVKTYGDGNDLRKKGEDAFAAGDFAEAGRLLGEAKSKFAASAQEARAFHVNMALESARTYLEAKKWEDCVAECAKILGDGTAPGWDPSNAEAQKLLETARHSMPRVGPLEYHFVRTGDTLDKIAASNGLAVSVLRELNGLTNDFLRVGKMMVVAPSRWGTVKSISEIVEWYGKAAEEGDATAQDGMGMCYYKGAGVVKDAVEAVKWFRKAAEQGYANAQFNLGLCYDFGNGVPKDLSEAVKWFRKAAGQGYANAQWSLGLCYYNGAGVAKNLSEAVKWYRMAAEQGHANAQTSLGVCYAIGAGVAKDLSEAVKWYRKAAERGDAEAQSRLGLAYVIGEGVEKDVVEAVKWFRKAAEQGYAHAQGCMGMCYSKGDGVAKDLAEAMKWYRKAAEQGYAVAQTNLGWCYETGAGVAKDIIEAVKWYRKAAEQGDERARNALKRLGR